MADSSATISFQFVNSTLSSPSAAQDLEVRAMIRKQAMKKVSAARKRDGNYGKHNLRQCPVFLVDSANDDIGADRRGEIVSTIRLKEEYEHKEDSKHKEESKYKGNSKHNGAARKQDTRSNSTSINRAEKEKWLARLAVQSLPESLSAKGYESTSMRTDFDILDLSTLASLHIGRAVRAALSRNLYQLIPQLRSHKRWSYLTFLPSRYAQSTCLSDAVDCVIARARQIVSPGENWEAAVITFYVKALASLQKALDCPKQRFLPEVLAATEVLALYELLDPSGETAWVRHTAGAAKLVQLRGCKNYTTEFEKALFMAQTVPIMTECLLNGNRCFLEQPSWQKVMRSVIDPSTLLSDRSEIVSSLLAYKCRIPGLFCDVTDFICSSHPPSPETISVTASALRTLCSNFREWYERYQDVLSRVDLSPGSANYDSHCKVFANYLSCDMVTSRLLGAVSRCERDESEECVMGLVERMVVLEREVEAVSEQTVMFMAQTLCVAKACIETSSDWRVGEGDEASSTGLIERWKVEKWCKLFGRRMPA